MSSAERKKELIRLVKKILEGQASEEEKQFVKQYYEYFDQQAPEPSGMLPREKQALENRMLRNIDKRIGPGDKPHAAGLWRNTYLRAAAVAIILISTAGFFFRYRHANLNHNRIADRQAPVQEQEALPGGNKAVLTLSNGSVVTLDSAGNGMLAIQGNSKILKVNGNRIAYQPEAAANGKLPEAVPALVAWNTLATPRGGQYQVKLPDGTEVWLNSASSLKFPARFTGNERKVILTGEAYFEVVENARQPFMVQVGDITVTDLGTHFNIMAYEDEPAVKTTLLEGAVKISRKAIKETTLVPGQQAVIEKDPLAGIKVISTDAEQAVAWKNGLFSFRRTDIHALMRQISRWYDVDVSFADSLKVFLNGNIDRNAKASEVFQMLELTGEVDFTIKGRTVIVRKHTKK